MGLGREIARRWAARLARTGYGRKALAHAPDLTSLRRKPTPSLYLGLTLIALSFVLGWAVTAMGVYILVEGEVSWLMAAVGVAAVVGVHLVFAAGVWLAGANYAAVLAHWLVRWFLLHNDAGAVSAQD